MRKAQNFVQALKTKARTFTIKTIFALPEIFQGAERNWTCLIDICAMRTRAAAFSLLALLLLQVAGMWFIYSTALVLHKEVKFMRLSNESNWISLTLSHECFHAGLLGEDELYYEGQYFDLVAYHKTNEAVHITAVKDNEENTLKRTLASVQSEGTGWSALAHYAYNLSLSPFILTPILANDPIHVVATLVHGSFLIDPCSNHCRIPPDNPPNV